MNAPSPALTVSYNIMYAGVVPLVNFANLDPSGRSDLLKTLDQAKARGEIEHLRRPDLFRENAQLTISPQSVTVTRLDDNIKELVVPLHQIASVGYVKEEFAHIVNVKIGEVDANPTVFDLAILYGRSKEICEMICESLNQCFQQVYRETVLAVPNSAVSGPGKCRTRTASSPLIDNARLLGASTPPPRAPSTASEAHSNDLGNDYIQLLTANLTSNELREFADLIGRWHSGELPVRELSLKLMELYGPDRKHLLAKLRHLMREADSEELSDFLRINGIDTSSAGGSSASHNRLSAGSSLPRRSTSDSFALQ